MSTETVNLANGLTCELPSDSPLARLLKSKRTWVGPNAKERLAILRKAKSMSESGVRSPDRIIAEVTHILGQHRHRLLQLPPEVLQRGELLAHVVGRLAAVDVELEMVSIPA